MLNPRIILSLVSAFTLASILSVDVFAQQSGPQPETDSARWNRILDWAFEHNEGAEFSEELFKETPRFSSKAMEAWATAVRELSQKNTNEKDWENLWTALDPVKVQKIPSLLMAPMGLMGNNKRFPGTYILEAVPRSILFSNSSLNQSWDHLLGITKPIEADAVHYEGVKGVFVYQSMELQNSVANLAQSIVLGEARASEAFAALSKVHQQKFIQLMNVGAEQHQIRPVELLAWGIRDIVLRELLTRNDESELVRSINATALGQMIQASILTRLGFPTETDLDSLMAFSATGGPAATYILLCAPGEMKVKAVRGLHHSDRRTPFEEAMRINYINSLIHLQSFSVRPDDVSTFEAELECAGQSYRLATKVAEHREPIVLSPEWDQLREITAEKPLIVLAGYTHRRTLERKIYMLASMYLQHRGFRVLSSKAFKNPKENFETLLTEGADVVLSVDHTLNGFYFPLGPTAGQIVELEKTYPNGKAARLLLALPPIVDKPENQVTVVGRTQWNLNEMSALLSKRRAHGLDPLTIVNLSCRSHRTVYGWMSAYQNSQPGKGDLPPCVIATEYGFDSNNQVDLLTNFEFPITFIDELMNSGSRKLAFEAMNSETPFRQSQEFIRLPVVAGLLKQAMEKQYEEAIAEGRPAIRYQGVANFQPKLLEELSRLDRVDLSVTKLPQ